MMRSMLQTSVFVMMLTALGACKAQEQATVGAEAFNAQPVFGAVRQYPEHAQPSNDRIDSDTKQIYTFVHELKQGDVPIKKRYVVMLGPESDNEPGSWAITDTAPGFVLYNGFAYIFAISSATDPQGDTEHGSAIGEGTIFVIRRDENANIDTYYLLEGTKLTVTLPSDDGPYKKTTYDHNRYLRVRYDTSNDASNDTEPDWEKIGDDAAEASFAKQVIQWAAMAGLRVPATPLP